MSDVFPMDRDFTVTTAANGSIVSYGPTSDENPNGAWYVMFVPSVDFDGQFAPMGRSPRVQTSDLSVPWLPVPYRRVTVNNVASDYAIVPDVIAPSAPYQVLVPAIGMSIGFLIECNAGTCKMYAQKMTGSTIP